MFESLNRLGARAALFLAVGWVPLLACVEGPDPDVSAVKRRATFELSCPMSQLKAYWLDDDGNTLGVSGCGTKLVYVKVCSRYDCEWVLNSDAKHREE
jgi:hypothetical protein